VGSSTLPTILKEDITKIKLEKQAEKMLVPTLYTLPGILPPTPVPATEPEQPIGSPLSSDESGSDNETQTEGQRVEKAHQPQIFEYFTLPHLT
jgi:hypothetical protein